MNVGYNGEAPGDYYYPYQGKRVMRRIIDDSLTMRQALRNLPAYGQEHPKFGGWFCRDIKGERIRRDVWNMTLEFEQTNPPQATATEPETPWRPHIQPPQPWPSPRDYLPHRSDAVREMKPNWSPVTVLTLVLLVILAAAWWGMGKTG